MCQLLCLFCLFDARRVVYMLQSCPMDDAVRLLNPILSAETWVSNKLQQVKIGQMALKIAADVCFWTLSYSPSALLGLVWHSAIGLERYFVLSASLMWPLWRLSCTFPGPKYSKMPGNLFYKTDGIINFKGYLRGERCVNASVFYIPMQILPEVLHLCLSTGGIKHPLHSAVIPQ